MDQTSKTTANEFSELSNVSQTPLTDPALGAHLEHANALLVGLGPIDALRVLGALSGAHATRARSQVGDGRLAAAWASSSAGMEQLATSLSGSLDGTAHAGAEVPSEGDEDEAEEITDEEETAARPRKERSKMRRLVAGMFDVSPRVDSCRLREVNALGGLAAPFIQSWVAQQFGNALGPALPPGASPVTTSPLPPQGGEQ